MYVHPKQVQQIGRLVHVSSTTTIMLLLMLRLAYGEVGHSPSETTKLTQELAVKLEQGETFVSGTQWQTEK